MTLLRVKTQEAVVQRYRRLRRQALERGQARINDAFASLPPFRIHHTAPFTLTRVGQEYRSLAWLLDRLQSRMVREMLCAPVYSTGAFSCNFPGKPLDMVLPL